MPFINKKPLVSYFVNQTATAKSPTLYIYIYDCTYYSSACSSTHLYKMTSVVIASVIITSVVYFHIVCCIKMVKPFSRDEFSCHYCRRALATENFIFESRNGGLPSIHVYNNNSSRNDTNDTRTRRLWKRSDSVVACSSVRCKHAETFFFRRAKRSTQCCYINVLQFINYCNATLYVLTYICC